QDFYDGIIVPERSLAFIADHIMVEKIEVEENFSLGDLSKHSMLTEQKIEIDDLFKQAYQSIGASLQAHKQIEKYYVKTMNFTRSNELIEQVKEQLFIESGQSKFDQPRVNRRLFGSNTIHGNYNVVAELLPLVERR